MRQEILLSLGVSSGGGAVCCAKARVTCEMFLSVAMATAEGASIPKVAEGLGISDQTLRNWIKQKTTGTPLAPTNGKVDDESMKLLGLETENRRLKKEVLQLKNGRRISPAEFLVKLYCQVLTVGTGFPNKLEVRP